MAKIPSRSNFLMTRGNTATLVIDIQERLVSKITDHERICWNAGRLIDAALLLGMPVQMTEQYPQGLGHTVAWLGQKLGPPVEKRMFSCRECNELISGFSNSGIANVLICGIETHVCVQQTALDLIASGFGVFVAVDAVGSRFPLDHSTALARMQSAGVTLTTTESALFEWCETSGADEFKSISKLVQQQYAPG